MKRESTMILLRKFNIQHQSLTINKFNKKNQSIKKDHNRKMTNSLTYSVQTKPAKSKNNKRNNKNLYNLQSNLRLKAHLNNPNSNQTASPFFRRVTLHKQLI